MIIDETGATVAKGRSKADAPEIDGAVYVASRRHLRQGVDPPQAWTAATVRMDYGRAYLCGAQWSRQTATEASPRRPATQSRLTPGAIDREPFDVTTSPKYGVRPVVFP